MVVVGRRRHCRYFVIGVSLARRSGLRESVPWYKARKPIIDYRTELPDFVILGKDRNALANSDQAMLDW